MPIQRRELITAIFCLAVFSATSVSAQSKALSAPNVVSINATLVTSGQPTADALSSLATLGFQAVIYLAPSSVGDAIKDEPQIVQRQGLEFIHIPISFSAPEERHFIAFNEALSKLNGKRTLVHCQVNMRASSFVFLHRVIVGKENPAVAYESVARIWSPRGVWKTFIVAQLQKNGIDFEPY